MPLRERNVTRDSRNGRLYRVLSVVALLVVGLVPVGVMGATAETPQAPIREVGKLDRISPEAIATWGQEVIPDGWYSDNNADRSFTSLSYNMTGMGVVVPKARLMLQIHPLMRSAGPNFRPWERTGIVFRDLDTLDVKATMVLPHQIAKSTNSTTPNGDFMHAVDGDRRVFFLDIGLNTSRYRLAELDLRTQEVKYRNFPAPLMGPDGNRVNGMFAGGLTYDAQTDSIILYFGAGAVTNGGTYIARIPLDGSPAAIGRKVRACTGLTPAADGAVGETLSVEVLPTKTDIFIACHRGSQTAVLVRMPRDSAFAFDNPTAPETELAGPVSLEAIMADIEGGRMFIATLSGEIWAFEAATNSFVGVISAGSATGGQKLAAGFGRDTETGRIFFQSPSYGFGVAEGRFFPLPQARTVPAKVVGNARILSDAKSKRVFVLEGYNTDNRARAYKIYAVDAAPTPPGLPDPDRNTLDLPEQAGKTESRFFGSGSGYGARVLLAKGIATVPPAVGVGTVTTGTVINDAVNSKCGYTDREMVAGRVAKAEYDTGSTSAEAIAVGVDERTEIDLERLSRCDVRVANPSTGAEVINGIFSMAPSALPVGAADTGPGWNRGPAECTSSIGEPKSAEGVEKNGARPLGASHTDCPEPGGKLLAWAESRLDGAVSVGKVRTDVTVERGAAGLVSTSVAVAQDINIAGVIGIGEIRAVAKSTSNGRPSRKPMSSYEPTIRNVSVAGQSICGDACDPAKLADQLTAMGLGRVEFRAASGLDERLLEGTPKGALTAVQKSVARQASDRALVGDFTADVPAFEMIVYNDNTEYGRARQIYQFAGVSSAATYNIVLSPTFTDLATTDADVAEMFGLDTSVDQPEIRSSTDTGSLDGVSEPITLAGDARANEPTNPITRVLRAIGKGLRLLLTSPRNAALMLTAWSLLGLPAARSRRRRLLAIARSA
jgi:hypothetical protein